MAESILIRLDGRVQGGYQWLAAGVCAAGSLQQLAQAAQDSPAIVLLPASRVLLAELDLPVKNAAQLRQAVPFALEDKLADEVENYHFVWLRQANQRLAVAALDKQLFADCVTQLQQAGIALQAVYPEVLCLPHQPGECSVLIEDDLAWLRYATWRGGAIEVAALPMLLAGLRAEDDRVQTLVHYAGAEVGEGLAQAGWDYRRQTVDEILPLLATQLPEIAALNLLTADYLPKPEAGGQTRRWLPALIVLALALALQLAWEVNRNWQWQEQVQAVDQQTQALFQRTFPGIKRIVNPRVQAEQALQEMRKQRQSGDSEFLRALYAVGEQLAGQTALRLSSLNFTDGGGLQLRVQAADEAPIRQFAQALPSDWAAHVQQVEKIAQGVEAQIDVKQQ